MVPRASPGIHTVTLRRWRAEKRIHRVQDAGAHLAGRERGTGTRSAQDAQECGHRVQRRCSNRDRSWPVAPADTQGMAVLVTRTSHGAGAHYWGLWWPSGPSGWSSSTPHQPAVEADALTIARCPRSRGRCGEPDAARAVTRVGCHQHREQPHKAAEEPRPLLGMGAPGAAGSRKQQDVVGRRWDSTCPALAGVIRVAAGSATEHHVRAGRQPEPIAPRPARPAWPAVGNLADGRGSRGARWLGGFGSAKHRERLLALSFCLGLAVCCRAGARPCWGVQQQLGGRGAVGGSRAAVGGSRGPVLGARAFGERRVLLRGLWELGLSRLCQQELLQVGSCPQPEPPSRSLLLSPQWCTQ